MRRRRRAGTGTLELAHPAARAAHLSRTAALQDADALPVDRMRANTVIDDALRSVRGRELFVRDKALDVIQGAATTIRELGVVADVSAVDRIDRDTRGQAHVSARTYRTRCSTSVSRFSRDGTITRIPATPSHCRPGRE